MADERDKLLDDLGDLDWDSALEEWEKNTFVPEVARDAETNTVASAPDVVREDAPRPAAGASGGGAAGGGAAGGRPGGGGAPAAPGTLRNLSSEGTVIAPVPAELRDVPRGLTPPPPPPGGTNPPARTTAPPLAAPAPPMRASSPSISTLPGPTRGGLGQLFARGKSLPPPAAAPPPTSTRVPSVTREVAAPRALADLDYDKAEGDPTLVGRGLDDAERSHRAAMADAPTVSTRDVEAAGAGAGTPAAARDTGHAGEATAFAPGLASQLASQTTAAAASELASHTSRDDADEPPLNSSTTETLIADRAQLASWSDADTQTRHPADEAALAARVDADADTQTRHPLDEPLPADDEAPTFMRQSPSVAPPVGVPNVRDELATTRAQSEIPTAEVEPRPEGELPVSRWLDEKAATSFRQRAAWLEEEARAIGEPTEQARALLAVSELLALVGDTAGAFALATEARDLAPAMALACRQVRQLMPADPGALVDVLDEEAARSPTPAARAHAMLVAADVLRTNGDGDGAVARWASAYKLDPADVRAPAARAALALGHDNHTVAGSELAENSELIALDRAVATALRLRGAPRPGTDIDLAMPINDALRKARTALLGDDVVTAAQAMSELAASEPSLAKGALWLSAALGSTHIAARRAAARALTRLANDGDDLARRQLASRGIELGDPELVQAALSAEAAFDADERAALLALAGLDHAAALEALSDVGAPTVLLDALAAVTVPTDAASAQRRASRAAGSTGAAPLVTLGRVLASNPDLALLDATLGEVPGPRSATTAAVALEASVRAGRWNEIADSLANLPAFEAGDQGSAARHVAAALVSERAGDKGRAAKAWRSAADTGVVHESVVRAIASLDTSTDLASELLRVADEMPDGVASAVLRLEALARRDGEDPTRAAVLDRAHRSAPSLGIAAFLAERIGRSSGDVDEVLRWIQERRATATDPLESALDAVREALLVADRDAELAGTRLEEAHRARPEDAALRELYERLATDPPTDRGAWRERRAGRVSGVTRALLLTEAALEYERSGDSEAALRAAKEARDSGDAGLSRFVLERAEVQTGATTKQTEDLLALAKETESESIRRETYERLADLDGYGRKDSAAALLWHRTILEESPRHLASLRHVEHVLVSEGRDEELGRHFEQIALALAAEGGGGGGELSAHAKLAARFVARTEGAWERTAEMARLAATQAEPSLWSLRALNAHARAQKDEEALLKTTLSLLERTQRPSERAALLLRASEAAARLEQVADARAYLEQAANEDPGDVVTWGFLAEVRERAGETRAAAEACESLARTSVVPEHQLLAWYDAARIWLDEVNDDERGMSALEHCVEIDVTHADVFHRLSALYANRRLDAELARLLEKRLAVVDDPEEKVALQVELSRALADMGELAKAKQALDSALANRPDHTTALGAMADLCAREGDWQGAEQAYVRLARLLATPEEQRVIYDKLGEIYAVHTVNLSRAEVAYKEVLKRAPHDVATLERLVDVYKRQGDVPRAVETQQQLVAEASDPALRLRRLVELGEIHETAGRDPRRAEQVLESARKEFPTSVVALRAMAEFYARQRQMPAMQILLDRAAGDARRSFAAGRFVTSLFEVLHAAYELRGRNDAARVVAATLSAVEGQPAELVGGEARAVDPRLDDVLAPDVVSPALRALLYRAGDALDAVSPLDLRALRAAPLGPGSPLGTTVGAIATVVGLGALQILVSPQLGRVAIPLSSNPPTLLVGEGLMNTTNERARAFVVVRALKMILSRASALLRPPPDDVALLVSALFTAFNPSFTPQGVDARRVADISRRIVPALPRNLDPTVGVIALEAAGTLGGGAATLAAGASAWANRVALLAVGDPNGALEAIAWSRGEDGAPKAPEARAAWIARTAEARELMTFSVTDGYSEARARLGLDR